MNSIITQYIQEDIFGNIQIKIVSYLAKMSSVLKGSEKTPKVLNKYIEEKCLIMTKETEEVTKNFIITV